METYMLDPRQGQPHGAQGGSEWENLISHIRMTPNTCQHTNLEPVTHRVKHVEVLFIPLQGRGFCLPSSQPVGEDLGRRLFIHRWHMF